MSARQWEQARKQREASDARIRRMDLADMPASKEWAFDADAASDKEAHEAIRDMDRIELMCADDAGKFRYAIHSMLRLSKYAFARQNTYVLWTQYAHRVFTLAAEAGNAEAHSILFFVALSQFAAQSEKRRARIERAQARSPEIRRMSAQKAAATRKRKTEDRKVLKPIFADGDAAMADVFDTAARLASMDK